MSDIDHRRKECRQVFDMFDKDRNGSLDVKELANGLRAIGSNPTDQEIKEMIKEGDSKKNHDGRLDFEEFFNLLEKNRKSPDQEQEALNRAFILFDKNGDGRVNRNELKEALTKYGSSKLTSHEVDQLFDEVDTDNDGFINYSELVNVIMR